MSAAPRRNLSKRVRFEVFKRDNFTCIYCGRNPPTVRLEADHILAVANGGGDELENLVTSCEDCNRGKFAVPLDQVPVAMRSPREQAERIVDMEEQVAEYRAAIELRNQRLDADVWSVCRTLFGVEETTVGNYASIKMFLGRLPFDEVLEAAELTRQRRSYVSAASFRYFCGCCWNKIRATNEGRQS